MTDPNLRQGRGNDTLFPQTYTSAFVNAVYPTAITTPPPDPGGGGTTPPGQIVQPKVLLEEWRADAVGTVDIDYSLGLGVVTEWRGALNGNKLIAPSLAQAPFWLATTTTPSARPAVAFDGVDDWLECLTLGTKLNNLSGASITLRAYIMPVAVNAIAQVAWIESAVASVPRLAYGRTGIGATGFYGQGVTRDADTVTTLADGVYDYEGWATHTARRDYLNGTFKLDYNGIIKASGSGIQTINYGDSSLPARLRLGAQNQGTNPAAFHLYGVRLYSYALDDNQMLADAAYYGGLA